MYLFAGNHIRIDELVLGLDVVAGSGTRPSFAAVVQHQAHSGFSRWLPSKALPGTRPLELQAPRESIYQLKSG